MSEHRIAISWGSGSLSICENKVKCHGRVRVASRWAGEAYEIFVRHLCVLGDSLVFSGLNPGREYRVWVMGLRGGATYTQAVEIISAEGIEGFTQSAEARQLFVNGGIGSSSEDLSGYAGLFTPTTHGEINIRVTGEEGVFLAGVAVQELDEDDDDGFSCFFSSSTG